MNPSEQKQQNTEEQPKAPAHPARVSNRMLAIACLGLCAAILLLTLSAAVLGISLLIRRPPDDPASDTAESTTPEDIQTNVDPTALYLAETPDAGMAYIDRMSFFGESTTTHLRARGVLTDGTQTHQVWADSSGTKSLSSRLLSETIVYPESGESLTVAEACRRAQPEYLVLSFGLNGLIGFHQNPDGYVNNYCKLIRAVQAASPNTKIILQTVYPIAKVGKFEADLATLNGYISALNTECLPRVAAEFETVRIADTASVLRDTDGNLAAAYDNGDGQHLTTAAYEAILDYLRRHAWE